MVGDAMYGITLRAVRLDLMHIVEGEDLIFWSFFLAVCAIPARLVRVVVVAEATVKWTWYVSKVGVAHFRLGLQ